MYPASESVESFLEVAFLSTGVPGAEWTRCLWCNGRNERLLDTRGEDCSLTSGEDLSDEKTSEEESSPMLSKHENIKKRDFFRAVK